MNRKHDWIVPLLLFICILLAAFLHDATADTMYCTVSSGYLNGRLTPGGVEHTRYFNGDTLEVVEIADGWAKVEGGEAEYVYCAVSYLSTMPPGEPIQQFKVTGGRVRLRETPGGEFVRWIEKGKTVDGVIVFDGWVYTGQGWIDKEYLQEVDGE